MTNSELVINALMVNRVRQHQLAERLKVSNDYITRRLRYELSDDTTKLWVGYIREIAEGINGYQKKR